MIRQCEKCSAATKELLTNYQSIGWSAYHIPNGCGTIKAFCSSHQEGMKLQMVTDMKKYGTRKK